MQSFKGGSATRLSVRSLSFSSCKLKLARIAMCPSWARECLAKTKSSWFGTPASALDDASAGVKSSLWSLALQSSKSQATSYNSLWRKLSLSLSLCLCSFMAQRPAVQIISGAPRSSAAGANKGHTCQHINRAHLMLLSCTRQPNDTQAKQIKCQPWCLDSEHLKLHPDRVDS